MPKVVKAHTAQSVFLQKFRKSTGIIRNRFMFIKDNLHPVMENIVLLHELGHDTLHREEATRTGGFEEFNIFEMQDNRMEYEANIFASQVALSTDDNYR